MRRLLARPAVQRRLALGLIVLILAPFVGLTLYVHPSADDYSYATYLAERGLWQNTLWYFAHWSGRYISNTVTSLTPLSLSLGEGTVSTVTLMVYRIVALLMIMGFAWSLWYLVKTLNRYSFKLTEPILLLGFGLVLAALLVTIVSPAELFYWYPASVAYCLPFITLFIGLALWLRWLRENDEHRRRMLLIGIAVCLVVQIGTQEMSLMVVDILLIFAGLVTWRRYRVDRSYRRALTWLGALAVAASIVAVAAPGNYDRKAIWLERGYGTLEFSERFMSWIRDLVVTLAQTVTSSRLIGFLVLLSPLLIWVAYRLSKRLRPTSPAWSIGLLAALWVGMSLPGLAASSPELLGAGRTVNTYNIVLLLMLAVVITHIFWFALYQVRVHELGHLVRRVSTAMHLQGIWLVLLLSLVGWAMLAPKSNISVAWRNLVSGSAARYDQQLLDRYELIENSDQDVTVVPALEDVPKTIFFDDITSAAADWRNSSYARFFGKPAIVRGNR